MSGGPYRTAAEVPCKSELEIHLRNLLQLLPTVNVNQLVHNYNRDRFMYFITWETPEGDQIKIYKNRLIFKNSRDTTSGFILCEETFLPEYLPEVKKIYLYLTDKLRIDGMKRSTVLLKKALEQKQD